jgi:hypothetical protein
MIAVCCVSVATRAQPAAVNGKALKLNIVHSVQLYRGIYNTLRGCMPRATPQLTK